MSIHWIILFHYEYNIIMSLDKHKNELRLGVLKQINELCYKIKQLLEIQHWLDVM